MNKPHDDDGRTQVLGVDPGIALCGYGVVEQNRHGLSLLAYGAIHTDEGTPLAERLRIVHAELMALIATYHPDVVAVEELFFTRNVRTAFVVGQARGVVLLAAAQAGLPVFAYKPQQVKMSVTGYGSAPKAQVQTMVRMVLRLDSVPQPDDAADAIAVAICHLHSARLNAMTESADI